MAVTGSMQVKSGTTIHPVVAGALAGVAGGVVFGMLMAMMGMLPMIGMLVHQDSAAVGFVVHMLISAFIGAVYGVVASRAPNSLTTALVGGTVNGMVWWVLGALILMPVLLGMTQMVLVIETTQWMSLMGHVIYGIVTGLAFMRISKR